MKSETVDFLSLQNQIQEQDIIQQQQKQNAQNIVDSYSHDWDIMAELIQNAIDAIDDNERIDKGILSITFNKQERSITIQDNEWYWYRL